MLSNQIALKLTMIDVRRHDIKQTVLLYILLLFHILAMIVLMTFIYYVVCVSNVVKSPALCEKCLLSVVESSGSTVEPIKSATGSSWNYWLALGAGVVVIGFLIYFSDSYLPSSPS